ncbi:MAG TPA: EAL domain-containing protein, partial [Candidatus Limnocylindrales bacterium]
AEVAGRVTDLDRAALEVVIRGAVNVSENLDLNLNVSPRTLESPEFNVTVLMAILKRHNVRPERVVVELTEREAVVNPDRLRSVIQSFQKAGIRLAADDVGAGNAGLRLLSQFKFDVVKIDLSLVQGARQDQTMSVLTSLVQLANRWGAVTIAEGVETPTQLRTIRQLGITSGQGYLLGRPGTERDIAWIDLEALEAREDDSPAAPPPDLASLAAAAPRTLSSSPLLAGMKRPLALRRPTKTPQN